jgi:hypothetical protein
MSVEAYTVVTSCQDERRPQGVGKQAPRLLRER